MLGTQTRKEQSLAAWRGVAWRGEAEGKHLSSTHPNISVNAGNVSGVYLRKTDLAEVMVEKQEWTQGQREPESGLEGCIGVVFGQWRGNDTIKRD